jgi:hypothetical protein
LRQAPLPSQVPSLPQVDAPASTHCAAGVGSWPAGTLAQVPALPYAAHDLQVPRQAVLQQTPCSQNPELHCAAVVHDAPGGSLPQLLFMQMLGETQSALVAQSMRHALLVAHTNGSHIDVVAGRQRPAPSQVRAEVNVDPLQEASAQVIPAGHCRQAPLPSQVPSLPHVDLSEATHWLAGAGGIPAAMALQVPTLPVRLHALHVPPQATLQQTP